MPRLLALILLVSAAAFGATPEAADPASDAPEVQRFHAPFLKDAGSYPEALEAWQAPEDINAWIGARFTYDMPRALLLSETQRRSSGRLPVHQPHEFFAAPSGVCVDLARFAVESLRYIDPDLRPGYLMIEFAPVTIAGNTLRMHWLASFARDGKYYFFADSKRPGHIAGPYASTPEFIAEYAAYRGRQIVAFRELDSHQRKQRTLASKQHREDRP